MKKITNRHINNYLEENGCYPKYECGDECYYKPSRKFFSLLDSYFIKYNIFHSKF